VLLRDGRLAALPPHAELSEVRQHDLLQELIESHRRELPVDHRLRGGLVEGVERRRELALRSGACDVGDGRVLRDRCAGDERRRFRRSHAGVEVLPHQAHALEIIQRVEPQTAGRAGRAQQSVPALPGRSSSGLTPERLLSSPIRRAGSLSTR
jgi:hypothetical protein